ncbi:MAG: hypothetical protein R3211_01470 [Balneolaceae bacterium]|nr:hypothetical protein [Balneolaceae bacterium]
MSRTVTILSKFTIPVCIAVMWLIGCREAEQIRGFYAGGWEWSEFQPCQNLEEQWWVTGDSVFFSKYDSLTTAEGHERAFGPTVYIEGAGTVSRPGEYGHVGAYSRELEISRVTIMKYLGELNRGDRQKMEQHCADLR